MFLRGLPWFRKNTIIETLAKRESDDFTVFEIRFGDIVGNEGNNVFGDRIQGLVQNSSFNMIRNQTKML
ncbi:hypothetical protein ACO2FA_13380 [Staphylococcus warneri]